MTDYGEEVARGLGAATYEAAAAFMLTDETGRLGASLGFSDPMDFYFAGRHGVLGETGPEVAAAAHGFWAADAAKEMWPRVGKVCTRSAATEAFGKACAQHGEQRLADLSETDAGRLTVLAERLVTAAAATVLFAAWRATERPSTPKARATYALNLLREWRGGVHLAAVLNSGVSPLEAVLLEGGEEEAEAFGWSKPWPATSGKTDAMPEISRVVDASCGRTIAENLSAEEAGELLSLARLVGPMLS